MRKHTKRVKLYRKKGSKKMHGGMIGGLFGFGRKKTAPAPIDPNQAQAATTATVESDDFNS